MAHYRMLACAAVLTVAACHRSAQIPYTSAEAEQLRWLDQADVQADFRDHIERLYDTRFVSVYAFSFAGEFGIEDTPEARALTSKHGSRHIDGTTDLVTSSEHERLLGKAREYAHQYNSIMLSYLRDHPST
jgi:hypothetical protein